jgi:hypothetical protein
MYTIHTNVPAAHTTTFEWTGLSMDTSAFRVDSKQTKPGNYVLTTSNMGFTPVTLRNRYNVLNDVYNKEVTKDIPKMYRAPLSTGYEFNLNYVERWTIDSDDSAEPTCIIPIVGSLTMSVINHPAIAQPDLIGFVQRFLGCLTPDGVMKLMDYIQGYAAIDSTP